MKLNRQRVKKVKIPDVAAVPFKPVIVPWAVWNPEAISLYLRKKTSDLVKTWSLTNRELIKPFG